MLLCQIEMRSPVEGALDEKYFIVGRYGFDPGLDPQEEVWVNWQVLDQNFEIKTRVVSRRKEIYVDGKSIVLRMSDAEKSKFLAIYPDGINSLLKGASLLLLRIFVEAEDRDQLLQIQEAIAKEKHLLNGQRMLPHPS